ncbi:hypothetical protein EJ03DRAFT_140090 [Teratosphaeria nubilosa]|uniref:Uncharacterized protein n=1 Tax=Teratosphaeria nubilosa TaxID=161662 RepID=A0A6G1L5S1_9PEZI|nr:hypothetical protein EJ03DRAFT_140090 [Teratosphaeria nubilosa]
MAWRLRLLLFIRSQQTWEKLVQLLPLCEGLRTVERCKFLFLPRQGGYRRHEVSAKRPPHCGLGMDTESQSMKLERHLNQQLTQELQRRQIARRS